MKSISRSSLLIIVFFTFTSCMPPLESSRVLYERGVVYESISQPFTVIKSKDGDIASKCLANYSYKDINFRFSFGGGSYTNFLNREIFVILDKEKLIKDVLSQANSTAIFGEKKRIQIDIAWYVKERIPEEFDSDISELLLPEKFQNDAEVTIWEKEESLWSRTVPFKLKIEDKEYDVFFSGRWDRINRTMRRWWGYPCLIFMPVTLVIDLSATAALLVALPIIIVAEKL